MPEHLKQKMLQLQENNDGIQTFPANKIKLNQHQTTLGCIEKNMEHFVRMLDFFACFEIQQIILDMFRFQKVTLRFRSIHSRFQDCRSFSVWESESLRFCCPNVIIFYRSSSIQHPAHLKFNKKKKRPTNTDLVDCGPMPMPRSGKAYPTFSNANQISCVWWTHSCISFLSSCLARDCAQLRRFGIRHINGRGNFLKIGS